MPYGLVAAQPAWKRSADGDADGRQQRTEYKCSRNGFPEHLSGPCEVAGPIRCATCTENPVAAAAHSPQNSHVVVDTNPMEADAFAPRLPTIEASIYCIAMEDNWAITAGALR